MFPSRMIVGTDVEDERLTQAAHTFAELLQKGAIKENIDTLFMGFTEAEAVNVYPKFSVEFSWAMMTGKIIHYCRKMRFRVQVWG